MIKNIEKVSKLKKAAHEVKKDILKISYNANVGHIGSSLSIADLLTVLYLSNLNVNPKKSTNPSRDRFILSKGHAAAALFCVLQKKGFISVTDLATFCADGGKLGSHPVYDLEIGVELSTGSLGHGLSVGTGMALGLRNKNKKNNPRVFVLISDAEINEGSVWEAIMFAGHHKLDNLVVILDDNNYQAFGKAKDVINMQPLSEKWENFGWSTKIIDGHNIQEIFNTFNKLPFKKNKPSVIIAKTKTAKGISLFENKQEAHYMPLNKLQYEKAIQDLEKLL